jgi:proteic killer suppression protein
MEVIFNDDKLSFLYKEGKERGKPIYGEAVVKSYIRKVDILASVNNSRELIAFKSLHFEALKKGYKGFNSIRVNDQYRIVFKILKQKGGAETIEIAEIHELTDYH